MAMVSHSVDMSAPLRKCEICGLKFLEYEAVAHMWSEHPEVFYLTRGSEEQKDDIITRSSKIAEFLRKMDSVGKKG